MGLLWLATAACGRQSAESRAAERAQDACIGALAPVADQALPSTEVLDKALADAGAAATVDDRWAPLLARLEELEGARGTPGIDAAVDDLTAECERVNGIIRRGGKDPDTALRTTPPSSSMRRCDVRSGPPTASVRPSVAWTATGRGCARS